MAMKPEHARPSKASLCKCVFIYLFSFRKLGNWKPRAVYNQTSTNIQAVHIQLLTLLEASVYSADPSGKHTVDDRGSTKIMLQSQPLACPSVLPVPGQQTIHLFILCWRRCDSRHWISCFLLLCVAIFCSFFFFFPFFALIPVTVLSTLWEPRWLAVAKFPRITSHLTVTGQPCLPSEIPHCKQVKAWHKHMFWSGGLLRNLHSTVPLEGAAIWLHLRNVHFAADELSARVCGQC